MTFPIVTEMPLRLEPTTRDTFLDEPSPAPSSGPGAARPAGAARERS